MEFCEDEAIEIPGVKEAADSDQANKKVGILMKKVFGEGESIDVDDYHVERRETQIKRDDGNGYYPSRTYVFSKTPEPQQRSRIFSHLILGFKDSIKLRVPKTFVFQVFNGSL